MPNVVYTSPNRLLEIGRLDTFEQADSVDKYGHWYICNNPKIFENYKMEYTIYIIHDMELANSESRKHLIVFVDSNGSKEIYDKNDHAISIMNGDIVKLLAMV